MRGKPIYGLDVVRFFAASSVLIYHLGYKAFAVPSDGLLIRMGVPAAPPPWTVVSWWGWIGVQLFFVISGLVIAYSVEGATWRSFVRSRIARLVPTMVICATLIAVVAVTWSGAPVARVLLLWTKSVIFFPLGPWIAGQFWTLPIEIFFYGAVWLMILVRSEKHLEGLAWAMGLSCTAYWLAVGVMGVSDPWARITQLIPFQHGCYFAIGIVMATVDRKGLTPGRVLLGLICLFPAWLQIAAATVFEKPGYGLETQSLAPFLIWLAGVGAIAACLFWQHPVAEIVGKAGPVFRTIGLITYPLYLLHMHVGGPVLVETARLGAPMWLAVIFSCSSAVATAWLIALYVEPPLHRYLSRRLLALSPRTSPPRRLKA